MADKPIHYEPHPVSSERKAELVAQGVTIIDAAYMPTGLTAAPDAVTREDIATMDRKDVVALLNAHGVEGATGKVADLRKWLVSVMFVDA